MEKKGATEVQTVGCGGLLLIPFSTIAVGVRLLFAPGAAKGQRLGPYRAMASADDRARPLTAGSLRIVGAMFLFWTLLLPGVLAARSVMAFWTAPGTLVPSVGFTWVTMLIGHLISMKLFQVMEPRLPHERA